mmetsp:Transcript_76339/g.166671  ORF Transcript_76339/g.166671 Transcript_76339/m.166671 type:complete len:320 (+) Transcript_76339:628-1587(+)
MVKSLLGAVPIARVHLKEHPDEVFGVLGDVLPIGRVERKIANADLGKDLSISFTKEWWVAAEHDVHDDADAPHVAELIVLARQDLRRHVVRRAGLRLEKLAWFELARKTEIDDFEEILLDGVLGHEQEIFRFEISVANMVLVHVVDGPDNLLHQYGGLDLGEVSGLDNSVEEFSSSSEFHHEVDVSVVLEGLVELDDVRVVHHLHDCDLQFETLYILHRCLRDGFHGTDRASGLARGSADGAIRSLSELPLVDGVVVADVALVVYYEGGVGEAPCPRGSLLGQLSLGGREGVSSRPLPFAAALEEDLERQTTTRGHRHG